MLKKLLAFLLDTDALDENGRTPLMEYAAKGRVDMIKWALLQGADLHKRSPDGRNALMEAVENGRLEAVTLLIQRGARLNDKDLKGHTPLMLGIRSGYQEISRILIECGADLHQGFPTPMMLAQERGDAETLELLKNHGAKS